jgi:Domain of unknown function (DUF4166)
MPVQASSLYASVLGPGWAGLPTRVRRLHEEGAATGHFTIRRGAGPLSTLLGWLCGFPAAGEGVPTRLRVRWDGEVQHWERSFGGHALATVQRAWQGGFLGERLGPMECVFRLRAVDQGIAYEQVSARLCLGPWRLPLPRLLGPRVEGLATEATGGMRVSVKIGSALTGWLLTYEGLVNPEEESA